MIAAVVALIALSIVLDRQGPDRPKQPAGSGPALTPADVARIARRVERLRALRFERPVKPLFKSRAEAARLQLAEAAKDYSPAKRRADEESLKLLGLLRPRDSIPGALSAVAREEVLGFYDPRSERLVVVRDRTASRSLLEITLAHELVHALEDQRFGLHESDDPGDDEALARSALAEGTATTVMAEYALRYFGIDDALALFNSVDSGAKLPTYIEDALLFPYEQGIDFVATFRAGSRSWKALDNVIRLRPPESAEQVLHPRKYAVGELPAAIGTPDLATAAGSGWQRLGASSVGEFDLRELFKILEGSPRPRAAAGWDGGRFELWQRGDAQDCTAPCVSRDAGFMSLAWDTVADRAAAERELASAFEKGLGARFAGRRAGARLWSSRGGIVALRGARRQTKIVFAPDGETAGRLLALR